MANKEIEDYAKTRLEQDASHEVILNELKGAGWSEADLAGLFRPVQEPVVQNQKTAPVPPSVQPVAPGMMQGEGINKLPTSKKIGKFKASWMIMKGSWNLLKRDKEMMLFPIFSLVANLFVLGVFVIIVFFVLLNGDWANIEKLEEPSSGINNIVWCVITFCIYLTSYFIVTFSETGVVSIAHGRMNGKDLSFKDGLNTAVSIIGKIFVWSVLSATVGMILRTVAERSKILGKIVIWMLGSLWSILTYFIVPVMLLENLSVKDSLKKSAKVINTTWGEAAVVNIGAGAIFGLFGLVGFFVFVGITAGLFTATEGVVVPIVTGVFLLLYFLTLGIISSTISTIFKVVLYEYSTKNIIPQEFSEDLLRQAFRPKKKKKKNKL